jgi:hypothetical protein
MSYHFHFDYIINKALKNVHYRTTKSVHSVFKIKTESKVDGNHNFCFTK